jgi:hypothetical protein
MGLGVHFAITPEQRAALLAKGSDRERVDYVKEEIEENWEEEWAQETDQAWDAIHRILTEHRPNVEDYDEDAGAYPLKLCIMGARNLQDDQDPYFLRLIEPDEVADVAKALEPIDEAWFTERYWKHCEGAFPEYGEDDLAYNWAWFPPLRDFFRRVAGTGRAVIFTADR